MKKIFLLALGCFFTMQSVMALQELPTKKSSLSYILGLLTHYKHHEINDTLKQLRDALCNNQVDEFIGLMRQFYAQIPYTISIEKEKYYQTIFYVILRLIEFSPEVERATNIGRIDMVVELQDRIYIFEFKLNGTAKAALQQIYDMRYYQPYLKQNKNIVFVGVNFSSKQRNIADYLFEEFVVV